MAKKVVRFGGRKSALAVAQTKIVMEAVALAHPELETVFVPIETSGDRNMKPFPDVTDKFGIKGLFTYELEKALTDGEIDVAVHSLKDVPMNANASLPIVACAKREDARDALVLPNGRDKLDARGAIACSSARRRVQLAALFPNNVIVPVRGNVGTRLRKLDEGEFAALVLAAAGLKRLGLEERISRRFEPDEMIPAPGQGILACQGRLGEDYYYLDAVRDEEADVCAAAERAFSAELGGGCSSPVGAYAFVSNGEINITGLYADEKGTRVLRASALGPVDYHVTLAVKLARELSDKLPKEEKTPRKKGSVALVGAGPGDAGLLTLRGKELLENAECVVYDRLVGDGILAMTPPEALKICVGKTGGGEFTPQREIEKILLEKAKSGLRVVRLKGGDPFLFGRGGEEIEALSHCGIPFEVVPGVPSAIGGLACAGIPATHRGVARSLHIITAHTKEGGVAPIDYEAVAKFGGTLVFLMGASSVPEICRELSRAGMPPETPAAAVESAASAPQRLISGTLSTLADKCAREKLKSPAIIAVGEAVSFAERFSWKKFLPLSSCKVVVTRPRGKSGRLSAMLRERGAEVVELPCISTRVINAPLPDFSKFGWLGFTSAAGAEALFALLAKEGRDVRTIGNAKIAAIGPATKRALAERGLVTDYTPDVFDGVHLARGLAARAAGTSVLLLRAKEGSPELTEELRAAGVDFTEIALYETFYEKPTSAPRGEFTAIFASASTVRGFCAAFPNVSAERACCIGEQTAREARRYGFRNIIVAKKATLESLVEALEEDMK